jgi:hypothetical protein
MPRHTILLPVTANGRLSYWVGKGYAFSYYPVLPGLLLFSVQNSPCPTGMTGTVGLAGLRLRRYASVYFEIFSKECRCTILPHYMDFKCEQKNKSTKIRICLKHRALPWLTGLVAGLMLPSPGCVPMPGCVKFMVDEVPMGQDFPRALRN